MGYYWREDGWDEEALCNAGFPIGLLPQVLLDLMWGYLGIWLGCLVFGNLVGVFEIWDLDSFYMIMVGVYYK